MLFRNGLLSGFRSLGREAKAFAFWGTAAAVMPHSAALQFMAGVAIMNVLRRNVLSPTVGRVLPRKLIRQPLLQRDFRGALKYGAIGATAIFAAAAYNAGEESPFTIGLGKAYHHALKPVVEFTHTLGAAPKNTMGALKNGVEWVSGLDLTADTGRFARQEEYLEYRTVGKFDHFFRYADPEL